MTESSKDTGLEGILTASTNALTTVYLKLIIMGNPSDSRTTSKYTIKQKPSTTY